MLKGKRVFSQVNSNICLYSVRSRLVLENFALDQKISLSLGVIFQREKFLSLPCPQVFVCERKLLGFKLGFLERFGKGKFLSRTCTGQNFQGQAWDGQNKDKPEFSPSFQTMIRVKKEGKTLYVVS